MTVLGTAAKVYAGGTAAVAVYAGSVKVWPLAPVLPTIHAQDDQQLRVMVWDQYAVDLHSGPYPIVILLSPVYRSVASGSVDSVWIDASSFPMIVRVGVTGLKATQLDVVHAADSAWATLTYQATPTPRWNLDWGS
jgi:hypothetical protein